MSIASSNRVLLLFGPTASGKTALLEELFPAEGGFGLPPAEVISADSMQVYKGMDIGTAKPDGDLLRTLPHHLIDLLDPSEQFTAGDFVRRADALCAEISRRNRLPVVSGGTAFYIKNFVCGLPESPAMDPSVRDSVERDLREKGASGLREELEAGDPVSAARIHPSDLYRLTRAVEVLRLTGRPLSSYGVSKAFRPGFNFLLIALERPREELYARIDARVDAMFAAGLADEFRKLLRSGCSERDPGMQAIGYREFFEAMRSGCVRLRDVKTAIAQNSRRYAKRQLAFFRALPGVEWFSARDYAGIRERVASWWSEAGT